VIIASNGIWNNVTNQNVVDLINQD